MKVKLKGNFLYVDDVRYDLQLLGIPDEWCRLSVKRVEGQLVVNGKILSPEMGEQMANKLDIAIMLTASGLLACITYVFLIWLILGE